MGLLMKHECHATQKALQDESSTYVEKESYLIATLKLYGTYNAINKNCKCVLIKQQIINWPTYYNQRLRPKNKDPIPVPFLSTKRVH